MVSLIKFKAFNEELGKNEDNVTKSTNCPTNNQLYINVVGNSESKFYQANQTEINKTVNLQKQNENYSNQQDHKHSFHPKHQYPNSNIPYNQNQNQNQNNNSISITPVNFAVTWRNLKFSIEPKWHQTFASTIKSPFAFKNNKKQSSSNLNNAIAQSSNEIVTKIVLDKLDGSFKSGELTAILGPSGAGKTTLLDCLTGHRKNGLSGSIKISSQYLNSNNNNNNNGCYDLSSGTKNQNQNQNQNNNSLTKENFCSSQISQVDQNNLKVSIIPQNDHLMGHLTVYETLNYASKMKNCFDKQFNHKLNIKQIAQQLGLMSCLNTRINKLSGGQYKRVSIAQELLSSPDILILDEPTSGLDASTCYQTVEVLRKLTVNNNNNNIKKQIAVILTIHQPNSDVFQQFNHVYVVAQGGKCIYEGSPNNIESVINRVGLRLPNSYYNPATMIVEIAAGKYGLDSIYKLNSIQKKQYDLKNGLIQDVEQNSTGDSAVDCCTSTSISSPPSSISSGSINDEEIADDNNLEDQNKKKKNRLYKQQQPQQGGDNHKQGGLVNKGFIMEGGEVVTNSNNNNSNNDVVIILPTTNRQNKNEEFKFNNSNEILDNNDLTSASRRKKKRKTKRRGSLGDSLAQVTKKVSTDDTNNNQMMLTSANNILELPKTKTICHHQTTTFVSVNEYDNDYDYQKNIVVANGDDGGGGGGGKGGEKRIKLNSLKADQKFPFWRHTYLHFHRSWLSIIRDPLLCSMQLALHIIVPVMVSLVYGQHVGIPNACPRAGPMDIMAYALEPTDSALQLQEDLRTTLENIGYIFFKLYGIIFAAMTVTVLTFPLDMHVLVKEFRNGWYGLSSYFLGRTLADIPFQLTLPLLAMSLSYYATGQPYSYMQWRFLSITGILILSSLIAQSQGLLFGAILMDRMKAAVFVAPAATTPIILFAGFLVRTQSIPHYLRPLSNLSYLRYAIEACLISRYGFNQCECDPEIFNQTVPELPPIARSMLDYWLSSFKTSISTTQQTDLISSNNNNLTTTIETTTMLAGSAVGEENHPDLFNKLINSLAKANSFGRNITSCEQVVPYPMIDYDLKDSQLFNCFAILIFMLLFTRLLTFFIVCFKVKRKV